MQADARINYRFRMSLPSYIRIEQVRLIPLVKVMSETRVMRSKIFDGEPQIEDDILYMNVNLPISYLSEVMIEVNHTNKVSDVLSVKGSFRESNEQKGIYYLERAIID